MVETESQLLFGADNWSSAHIQTHVSDYRVDVLKGQCAHNLKGQHTKKKKKKHAGCHRSSVSSTNFYSFNFNIPGSLLS